MFLTILQTIGGVLGIASGILGVVSFWRDRIKHRSMLIVAALLMGGTALLLYTHVEKRQNEAEVQALREEALRRDAAVVSESIVISGWEDVGDFVGYLTQITGFYQRHLEQYQSEYTTYARQLQEWQDHLKRLRETGKTLYSSDWDGLKGLVKSGEDHLGRIANSHEGK